jgi:hypothetical protein
MGTCLFAKPLLSNGSCRFAYLAVVAQQRVYVPQYNAHEMVKTAELGRLRWLGHLISANETSPCKEPASPSPKAQAGLKTECKAAR